MRKLFLIPYYFVDFLEGKNLKTTYVMDYKELSNLKLEVLPCKKYVDYFFNRNKMVRWEPETNKFTEYTGLIDISFTREILLSPDEAKSEINIKNVQYLIRRKQMSEYFFDEVKEYGIVWHIAAENVKEQLKLVDEYHMVFDVKMEKMPPFKFRNIFYGNIYDYLETKNNEEKSNSV